MDLHALTRSVAIAVILAAFVTFLPGLRTIQVAEATDLTPPLPRFIEAASPAAQATNQCTVVTRIVRECPLAGMAAVRALEDQVIADALAIYKLPASDPQPISDGALNLGSLTNADRLLVWEKGTLSALLFDKIALLITKAPAARTADEQAIYDALAARVGQQRLLAATEAKRYFDFWQASPCQFVPPAGATYTPPQSCFIPNSLGAIFQSPPSFEQFQAYGAASAYGRFQSDADLRAAAFEAAKGYGMLAGLAAAGIAAAAAYSVVVSTALGAALVAAIFPFVGTAAAISASTVAAITAGGIAAAADVGLGTAAAGTAAGSTVGVGAAEAAGISIAVGAAGIAASVAIIVIAVTVGIIAAITVFTNEETPGKLDAAITAARTPPDLGPLLDTEAGKQEIFGAFLLTTFDTGPAGSSSVTLDRSRYLPQPAANEARFQIDPGPAERASDELVYKSWGTKGGRARLASGWFIDQDTGGTGGRFASLSIDYLNHAGEPWTAWRMGDTFLHTTAGNVKPAFTSDLIQYQDASGANHTAKYLPGDAGGTGPVGPVTVVTGTVVPPSEPVPGMGASLFRFYNPTTGDHFYTLDGRGEGGRAELELGYRYEHIEALVGSTPAPGLVPLYRLWSAAWGDHFYTISESERDRAVREVGYVAEGIAAYVAPTQLPGTVPLYRLWNAGWTKHFYTTDAAERDRAVQELGFVSEQVACYVAPYALR
jgi:hypothetical protein